MRVHLDRCYIYQGKFYGPGEEDVPAGLAKNLGVLETVPGGEKLITIVPDLPEEETEPEGASKDWKPNPRFPDLGPEWDDGTPPDQLGVDMTDHQPWTDPGTALLPEDTPYLGILQAAGVTTVHDALSHPDLTQIKNIGPGRAFKIIEFLEA